MPSGSSFIVQIQIAIIGVVVVLGMFFMWRSISKLQDRLDQLSGQLKYGGGDLCTPHSSQYCCETPLNCEKASDYPDEDEYAAEMMKVFGGMDSIKMYVDVDAGGVANTPARTTCVLINDDDDNDHVVAQITKPVSVSLSLDKDAETETETDADVDADNDNPLSKSKLKKMSLDKLKELCRERNLRLEGSKVMLVNRILGVTRD